MKFRLTLALSCFIFFQTFLPAQNVVDSLTVNWETLNILGRGPNASEYQQAGNYLFYQSFNNLYRSADFGKTWVLHRRNVGKYFAFNSKVYIVENYYTNSVKVSLNCYHDFGTSKFYLSENGGDTYTALDTAAYKNYNCITGTFLRVSGIYQEVFLSDSTLLRHNYTADYNKKIEASKDGGKTWATVIDPAPATTISPFDYAINSFYFKKSVNASGQTTIIYGKQLNISDSTVIPLKTANFTSISFKDNIFSVYTCNYAANATTVESTSDKGLTWTTSVLPFTFTQFYGKSGIFQDKETIYIVGNGIYKSTDAAFKNYKKIYADRSSLGDKAYGFSILPSGIYINGLAYELLRSTDKGDTWEVVNDTQSGNAFNSLIAFKDTVWVQNNYSELFELTNFNSSKSIGNQSPIGLDLVEKGFKLGNKVFIGRWSSNDNGISWASYPVKIAADSNRIILFYNGKLSESKNKGTTFQDWTYPNNMVISVSYNNIFIDSTLYSLCYISNIGKSILRIKDEGGIKKFDILNLNTDCDIIKIFAEGKKLIAVSNCGKFYETTDDGTTWIQFGAGFLKTVTNNWSSTVEQYGTYYIFAPEETMGIAYITGDKGLTWKKINMNFKNTALSGKYIYNIFSQSNNDPYFAPNNTDKRLRRIHVDSLFKSVLNETDYGILRGIVFKDENANCKKDSLEKPITEKIIRFEPNAYTAISDKNGRFSVALPPNAYNISVGNVRYNSPICGDTILKNIVINARQTRDTQFVFSKTLSVFDAVTSLTALTPARPGFEVEFNLKISNIGTETIGDAVVTLSVPTQFASFVSADQGGTYLNGQITWNVKNLPIDESRVLRVRLKTSASTPLSTNLSFSGKTTILNKTDAYPSDNEDIVVLTVRGSYDPNDKTVLPAGKISFFTNELDYLIRFQNTGTDTAFKVVVVDTLPTNLDVFTLKPIASSHPYTVSMNKNIVTFTFDNILLVDSFHNEKGSHGFIRFKIAPKKGVVVGDKISNKAAIYFDFNKPIITNAAVTEFILSPTSDIAADFSSIDLYPNPVKDYLSIRYELKQATWISVDLYNAIGQKVKTLQNKAHNTEGGYRVEKDVKDLEAGIYQVAITTDKGTIYRKFVKMK